MGQFRMGRIVGTPGALYALRDAGVDPNTLLARHNSGDWGAVPPADARENDLSVRHGYRIISSYRVGGEKVWILTEADRRSTCLLLPEEY